MSTDNGFISVKPNPKLIGPTKWLWANYIPRGGLSLLVGNESVGKGYFACYLMSKLTMGELPGCYQGKKVRVEIVAYEDSEAEWNKRMDAAHADPAMWTMLRREDGSIFNFRDDLKDLIAHWRHERVKFVYIDQIQDHLGLMTDLNNSKQSREALVPFHASLDQVFITAMATTHPNKRGNTIREKVNGSVATLAVVRSALYIAKHPDDEANRVVVPAMNNRGSLAPALEFEIEDTPKDYRPRGRYVKAGVIEVLTRSTLSFDDLNQGRGETTKDELDRKVRSILADGKWHWYSDIYEKLGGKYSFNVLKRCAKRIDATVDRKGFPARARWRLSSRTRVSGRAHTGVKL